jgi:type I restriction enzyme S subunit
VQKEDIPANTNQAVSIIRLKDARWVPFVARFLSVASEVVTEGRGTGLQNLNLQQLRNFLVPLPPLPEQKRMVERIEALFARTRSARADLERAAFLTIKYQSSMISAEVDADDSELRPRIPLAEVVPPSAPIIYGILQPGPEVPNGVPYVRPTEIDRQGIQLDALRRTSTEIAWKYRRSTLAADDILLSIVGTIGKVAIVPPSLAGGNITQSSCRIRPVAQRHHPNFIALALTAPGFLRQIADEKLGTAVPRLNLEDVRQMTIPACDLNTQKTISEIVGRRVSSVRSSQDDIKRALALLDRLEQGILTRAFRGELVEQDPADEPAGALLARVGSTNPRAAQGRRRRTA